MTSPKFKSPVLRTPISCSRQKDVRELLRLGHWPQACPPDLRSHVDGCRICRDLAFVSTEVRKARDSAMHAARSASPGFISPGMLWWRAQLRRRQQAVEQLAKPILGAQIFAMAINAAAVTGLMLWRVRVWHAENKPKRPSPSWLARFDLSPSKAFHLEALWSGTSHPSAGAVWNWNTLVAWMTPVSTTTSPSSATWTNWTTLLPCVATLLILGGAVLYFANEKQ